MNNIEEINIVHEGDNYGWMKREGLFENGVTRPGGALNQLFPLPADDPGWTDEGRVHVSGRHVRPRRRAAVSGGFAYHGRIPALRGKFVFGDIAAWPHVRGRSRRDEEGRRRNSADRGAGRRDPVVRARCGRQPHVRDAAGARSRPTNGATVPRADLHISRSRDGELFITSRQDGMIRMLVPDSAARRRPARVDAELSAVNRSVLVRIQPEEPRHKAR